MSDKSHGQEDVAANVSVQVASVQPNQIHYLTPLIVDAASDTLVRQNSEVRGKQTVPVMSHSTCKKDDCYVYVWI